MTSYGTMNYGVGLYGLTLSKCRISNSLKFCNLGRLLKASTELDGLYDWRD